jgi:hypothetical protein
LSPNGRRDRDLALLEGLFGDWVEIAQDRAEYQPVLVDADLRAALLRPDGREQVLGVELLLQALEVRKELLQRLDQDEVRIGKRSIERRGAGPDADVDHRRRLEAGLAEVLRPPAGTLLAALLPGAREGQNRRHGGAALRAGVELLVKRDEVDARAAELPDEIERGARRRPQPPQRGHDDLVAVGEVVEHRDQSRPARRARLVARGVLVDRHELPAMIRHVLLDP